jgi:hypothetical protein
LDFLKLIVSSLLRPFDGHRRSEGASTGLAKIRFQEIRGGSHVHGKRMKKIRILHL